ncbi:hypothetical protein BDR04DRAFT_1105802 [Suillus decipiens]|nr:hypothetical protein BDR04DRAFT_1105802 [Suillus decipiens]
MSNPKFRIAICGGGVSGLTLAVALSRYQDIAVDVYEATQSYREIGAGIGVWPRAFRVWISENKRHTSLKDVAHNCPGLAKIRA